MSDKPTETPANDSAHTGTEPGQQAGNPERKFTQAELDSIIDGRLKREREKYADYADLKKKAEAWTTYEEAQKSEAQKMLDKLAATEKQMSEIDNRRKAALIKSAFMAEAVKHVGADRLDAAYKLLEKDALSIDEHDNVAGMTDAIKALVEANPFLKLDEAKPASKLGATNPGASGTTGGVKDWHPLYKNSTGGFKGRLIPPPGETNK